MSSARFVKTMEEGFSRIREEEEEEEEIGWRGGGKIRRDEGRREDDRGEG